MILAGLLLLPLAFLGGLAFGSAGMVCTSLVPNIELFNLPVFLFITPMFLFGGTFFPVENLPGWAQTMAALIPLTHLVDLSRAFTNGRIDAGLLPGIAYLAAFAAAVLDVAALVAIHAHGQVSLAGKFPARSFPDRL